MLTRPVRVLAHVGAITLLSGTAFVAMAGSGIAAAPERPDSYGGDATASTFHLDLNRKPGLFPAVDNPINSDLPYASTSIDSSGGAAASAAPYTPGQGVLGVPALICVFAGPLCQKVTPPDYPFIAYAQYPAKQDAKATVSPGTVDAGPAHVTMDKVVAHADQSLVEATTDGGGTGVKGALSADGASAHSMQHFVGSTLVATTESVVTGLEIAKALHIDSVTSVATAKVDGGKVSASTAKTTISGATLAGTPVIIDSHGIHVADKGDGGAVTKQLNAALKALKQAGVSVRQLGTTQQARKGVAAAHTGGLLITFTRQVDVKNPVPPLPCVPVPNVPCVSSAPSTNGNYFGTVTIAGAGVSAFATPAGPPVDFNIPAPLPSQPAGGASDPTLGGGPAAAPPAGTDTVAAPDSGTDPQVAPDTSAQPRLAANDTTWKRIRTLAAVLLLYPLLVLLARPLRAPSRLPGGG